MGSGNEAEAWERDRKSGNEATFRSCMHHWTHHMKMH